MCTIIDYVPPSFNHRDRIFQMAGKGKSVIKASFSGHPRPLNRYNTVKRFQLLLMRISTKIGKGFDGKQCLFKVLILYLIRFCFALIVSNCNDKDDAVDED